MGLFEERPWLLVPLIVAVIEAWSLLKKAVGGVRARLDDPLRD